MSDLTLVVLYPELLGLYADRGNAVALRHRAALRGISAEIVEIHAGETIPAAADFYLLGGAEDAAIATALGLLRDQATLGRAIGRGATVLGVCAGFQLLGHTLIGPDGEMLAGLGHLDVESRPIPGDRAVGDVLATSPTLGELQGFENHRGDARLGPDARPLATVVRGTGNGHGRSEGAVQGNVVGTYLHGPALVRNPALADMFLAEMTGHPLPPVVDEPVERLRTERRDALTRGRRWRDRLRPRLPSRLRQR